jgi:hypothetical protein
MTPFPRPGKPVNLQRVLQGKVSRKLPMSWQYKSQGLIALCWLCSSVYYRRLVLQFWANAVLVLLSSLQTFRDTGALFSLSTFQNHQYQSVRAPLRRGDTIACPLSNRRRPVSAYDNLSRGCWLHGMCITPQLHPFSPWRASLGVLLPRTAG